MGRSGPSASTPEVPGVTLSNLDKVLFPAIGFTKRDLLRYYLEVAPALLPHLARRPVTLKRYPDGVTGPSFWEKDAPKYRPSWVRTAPVPRAHGGPPIQYTIIGDRRTLAWCANLAAIELHPFLHRGPALGRPTSVVFDLDPGEGTTVLDCVDVALLLRQTLTRLGLRGFVKVSGSKGLQLYVPLNTPVSYETTGAFAHALGRRLEDQHSRLVISDMTKSRRRGRVFVDWSQNAAHKSTVAVYSVRAKRDRPFVSVPVTWSEVARARREGNPGALSFEPEAALARVRRRGDLFAGVLTLTQVLPDAFTGLGRSA
jgi:bifunctional non-homologous end joining protein LigD